MSNTRDLLAIGYDQQPGATRKNAPQEDALQALRVRTSGGLDLSLAVIADGEGGQGARRAADLAVNTAIDAIRRSRGSDIPSILEAAFDRANAVVLDDKSRDPGMGEAYAALTVAAVHQGRLYLAYVGNAPAFLVRGGEKQPAQLTVDQGMRGRLREALGLTANIRPDTRVQLPGDGGFDTSMSLQSGDHVILCTDGLIGNGQSGKWQFVTPTEMKEAVEEKTVQGAAQRLVTFPMSRNVDDNVSVVVLRVPRRQVSRPLVAGLVVTALALPLLVGVLVTGKAPYLAPTATPYPDRGRAVVQTFTGTAWTVQPDSATVEHPSGTAPVALKNRHGFRTGSGTAKLVFRGAEVYLGKSSELWFEQLESENPSESEHVILRLETGQVLIRYPGEQRNTFDVIVNEGVTAKLRPGNAGAMGVIWLDDKTAIVDCLAGACEVSAGNNDVTTTLRAGDSIRATGHSLDDSAPIPDLSKTDWQQLCDLCSFDRL